MTEDGAKQGSLAWAVERWHAEVQNRPMHNVHRRALDTTWRQVIRHFGGDPDELLSMPPHHEMSSTSGKPIAEAKLATIAKPVAWRVGVWGDGSTPYGRSNIFCDEHEATIVANIATHHAEVIVAAHNAALSELAVAPIGSENAGQPQQRDAPQAQAMNAISFPLAPQAQVVGTKAEAILLTVRRLLVAEEKHARKPHGTGNRQDVDDYYSYLVNYTPQDCDAALALIRCPQVAGDENGE